MQYHRSSIHPDECKWKFLSTKDVSVYSLSFSGFSAEFGNVVERSLEAGADGLMEEMEASLAGGSSRTSGIPLARLVPRVAQMGPLLLEDPIKSRFIQMIRGIPEAEIFFTLLYANMPAS